MSNLQESQQYRCVVSNEAGRTRSNVATITVLSKLVNYTMQLFVKYLLLEITTHPQNQIIHKHK